jgi:hypothetical protein
LAPHLLEAANVVRQVADPLLHHLPDVIARSLAPVAEGEYLPDLAEGEPDRLRRLDEAQPLERRLVVVPVAGGGALRLRQDPDVFVVGVPLRIVSPSAMWRVRTGLVQGSGRDEMVARRRAGRLG